MNTAAKGQRKRLDAAVARRMTQLPGDPREAVVKAANDLVGHVRSPGRRTIRYVVRKTDLMVLMEALAIFAGTDATPEPCDCRLHAPERFATPEPVSSIPQRTPFESDPESPR